MSYSIHKAIGRLSPKDFIDRCLQGKVTAMDIFALLGNKALPLNTDTLAQMCNDLGPTLSPQEVKNILAQYRET